MKTRKSTDTLASSRPRSLTGVPDLGETKEPSDNSSSPIIRPGHHEPFRRRTQTNPPTDASMPLDLASPELLPISEQQKNTSSNSNKQLNGKGKNCDPSNQSRPSILNSQKLVQSLGFMNECLCFSNLTTITNKTHKLNIRKSQSCMQHKTQ